MDPYWDYWWQQFSRSLPQPIDVFGGGNPGYPVHPVGWGDIIPNFMHQATMQPWPEHPPGYWDQPEHWPNGTPPEGWRF